MTTSPEFSLPFLPLLDYPPASIEAKKIYALRRAIIYCLKELGVKVPLLSIHYCDSKLRPQDCGKYNREIVIGSDRIVVYYHYSEPGNPFCSNVYTDFYRFLLSIIPHNHSLISLFSSPVVTDAKLLLFGPNLHPTKSPEAALIGEWVSPGSNCRYVFDQFSFIRYDGPRILKCTYEIFDSRERYIQLKATFENNGNTAEYCLYFDDGYFALEAQTKYDLGGGYHDSSWMRNQSVEPAV